MEKLSEVYHSSKGVFTQLSFTIKSFIFPVLEFTSLATMRRGSLNFTDKVRLSQKY